MSSLALSLEGDLILAGDDLVRDEGLASAILVSLLTDRRAEGVRPEEQRGWWGDEDGDRVGSLLWTLLRAKATQETVALARDHAVRALEWLVDEEIAERVEVSAELQRGEIVALDVAIVRGTSSRWSALWDAFSNLEQPWEGGLLRVRAI